jgi:hypothetical protein
MSNALGISMTNALGISMTNAVTKARRGRS